MKRDGSYMCALIAAVLLGSFGFVGVSEAAVKGQYIARFYTEALGRLPDQGAWVNAVNYFAAGCNAARLKSFGVPIYTSTEYNTLGYDNVSRLLTLYRGVWSREPDELSFNNNLTLLNTGTSWSTMVNSFFDSSIFTSFASYMCANANYGFDRWHYPLNLPTGSQGFTGTQAQLQSLINSTPSGGTIYIAQRAVVTLSSQLTVKAGRTLATYGNPDVNHYANMARLVRTQNFGGALVKVEPGAKLKSIWVDGQRNHLQRNQPDINILMAGGANTEVSRVRSDSTTGGANLHSGGIAQGYAICSTHRVTLNLVTGYTNGHYNNQWADGINIGCEDVLVENNQVVDMTDVAIIFFGAAGVTQHSIARYNTILNAGNSAYGGLSLDPWKTGGQPIYFTGAMMNNNTLWSGPSVHFDIALVAGGRPWYGNEADRGYDGKILNNTSGSSRINVDIGISVSAMMNATVTGNSLSMTHVNVNPCPTVDVAAAISAGWASGTIQSPITDTDVSACVYH